VGNRLIVLPRAVDNQVFFGMCSPARDLSAGYHAVRQNPLMLPTGLTIANRVSGVTRSWWTRCTYFRVREGLLRWLISSFQGVRAC